MSNDHLKSYFDYYLKLNSPGYAVLVTGEWGSGKTYQTLNAIPKEIQCHVSLFGISNTREIYSSVFAKMYPGKNFAKKAVNLTKDITSEIDGITFGAGAFIGNLLDSMIKESVDKDKVIIFDDLERCPLDNKEVLGVINQYVEHHQCRVIILAHDKKIHDDFLKSKEKIIGHTIKVTPQIDEAGDVFFSSNYKINNFKKIKPVILDSFTKTGCQSLRVLKYVINDCERLLNCLEPKHIKNIDAMQSLFITFCIINSEYRIGNLTYNDIEGIHENYNEISFRLNDDEFKEENLNEHQKRMVTFLRKYNEFEIISSLIDYQLLSKIMETGDFPKNKIISSINTSNYFINKQKTPAWLTIISFDRVDDDIINDAINELFENIKTLKLTDIGELIHSFCILYMLSENNIIDMDFDELERFEKDYINSIFDAGLLPSVPLVEGVLDDDVYERSYGHMYWIRKSYENHVENVITHLKQKRKETLLHQYPSFSKEILTALEYDIEKFKYIILGSASEPGIYSQIDILNSISHDDFLISWLMLPVEHWDKVRMVLNARYKRAQYNLLQKEKDWIYGLCVSLMLEAQTLSGLQRSRIERLIPYSALRAF